MIDFKIRRFLALQKLLSLHFISFLKNVSSGYLFCVRMQFYFIILKKNWGEDKEEIKWQEYTRRAAEKL